MDLIIYILLCVLAVLCLILLRIEGLLRKNSALFISAGVVLFAFVLRARCLPHITYDYQDFLVKWVDHFRANGGFRGIVNYHGNYNIPYLYFLALFSYSDMEPLGFIKLLSILFDVLLAWGVCRLTGVFGASEGKRRAAFLGTLLLPTVLLNGVYWSQCDSIYVALAIWSLYFIFKGKPCLSMVFLALSFSFKLQAIFFLPVYFLFLCRKQLKLWQLPIFPLTYLVVVLPAVLLGKPFSEPLTLYFSQMGTVGSAMNYNSPSVFALLRPENTELASKLAIGAAFAFILLVYALFIRKAKRTGNESGLTAALLLVVAIPFLLPHMHDRYFFGADVLSFAVAFVIPELLPVPILCSFASLLGYHAYLRGRYLMPMSWGAVALILAIIWLLVELFFLLRTRANPRKRKSG